MSSREAFGIEAPGSTRQEKVTEPSLFQKAHTAYRRRQIDRRSASIAALGGRLSRIGDSIVETITATDGCSIALTKLNEANDCAEVTTINISRDEVYGFLSFVSVEKLVYEEWGDGLHERTIGTYADCASGNNISLGDVVSDLNTAQHILQNNPPESN